MALTFATGLTSIANGDASAMTDYAFFRASGTGGTGSLTHSTDLFREGTGCVSYRVQANWEAGILFDYYTANSSTVLNMTTTGRHLFLWFNALNVAFLDTDANNGIFVIATADAGTSGTPTNYARWVVGGGPGSTIVPYSGGWRLVVLDMNKTPTTTVGTGCNVAQIRRLGIGIKSITGTVKTENLYLDAMWYGQANYKLTGDGTTVADWDDFIADSETNENGLFEDLGGAVAVSCGVQFGDASQSSTTTFSDATNKKLFFRRHIYRTSGGAVGDCVDYANLYKVTAAGAAAQRTSITIGQVVGTGDARQGVLGGSLGTEDTTNVTWALDFAADKADLAAVKLYGLSIEGAKGGCLFDNNSGATETDIISTQFINCGEVSPGATGNGANVLSCSIIDPLGDTNNYGLLFPQTPSGGTLTHNGKNINFITSGAPTTQYMTRFTSASDYSVTFDGLKFFGSFASGTLWHGRNEGSNADITIQKTGGSDPVQAEFQNTAAGTVTVTASFVFTLTNVPSGVNVTIVNSSTRAELQHSTSTGADITYTHSGGETVDVLFMANGYDPNVSDIYDLTLPNADSSTKVQLISDPNYANP